MHTHTYTHMHTHIHTHTHTHTHFQSECYTSPENGSCQAALTLPTQWFSGIQTVATVTVDVYLLGSLQARAPIGSTLVYPRPPLVVADDVVVVLPSRPIPPGQLFTAVAYADATYSVATYSLRCEVGTELSIESVSVDRTTWMAQVNPPWGRDVTVAAVLRDPVATDDVPTSTQQIFSLQVKVSQYATGSNTGFNCSILYLGNIRNEKIQPHGMATPTAAMVLNLALAAGSASSWTAVLVDFPVPRGLLSYASQAQLVNTAVISGAQIRVPIAHSIAMSNGAIVPVTLGVSCTSNSAAFSLSPSCGEVILTGNETSGTQSNFVLFVAMNFSAVVSFRVWFPYSQSGVEVVPSVISVVEDWVDSSCTKQYQPGQISAYADFSYSPQSPVYRISVLPLVRDLLSSLNTSVVQIAANGTIRAVGPGTAVISAGPRLVPATVAVEDTSHIRVTDLDVTLFSGLTLSVPRPPYPGTSVQQASVTLLQDFAVLGTRILPLTTALLSDGSLVPLAGGATVGLESSDLTVARVSGNNLIVEGGGKSEVKVTWYSSCTGVPIAVGIANLTVGVPAPYNLKVAVSAAKITYPQDLAAFAGIPTSVVLNATLLYPDGQSKDVTMDPRLQVNVSQVTNLVSVAVSGSQLLVSASQGGYAFGVANITLGYASISAQLSVTVVGFAGLQLSSSPYPPYPGSDGIIKTTLYRVAGTQVYQRASLVLTMLLTDNSTIPVTSLGYLRTTSSNVQLVGNIVVPSGPGQSVFQGQLGQHFASTVLNVSIASVSIVQLTGLTIGLSTLVGIKDVATAQLSLDAVLSDSTVYPGFIPNGDQTFASLVSLSSDTPTAARVGSTGLVTLRGNHRALVTVTARLVNSTLVSNYTSFACNLAPAVGDIDSGYLLGIPVPPALVGSNFSLPVYINAGTQLLRTADMYLQYNSAVLTFLSATVGADWPGAVNVSVLFTGILSLSASMSSSGGVQGLVHIASLQFYAAAGGSASVGSGGILTLLDASKAAIGSPPPPRTIVAGDNSLLVAATALARRRKSVGAERARRSSVPCGGPLPCTVCLGTREMGDTNGDCVFTDADSLFLLQYLVNNVTSGLIQEQLSQFDADANSVVDVADAYFLHRVAGGLVNFLANVSALPVQSNPSCTLAVNVTLLGSGNTVPSLPNTRVFIDIGFPFDSTLSKQVLFTNSIFVHGTLVATKDLLLQGGVVAAEAFGGGVYGIELLTNLSTTNLSLSVLQVNSALGALQTIPSAQAQGMFKSPDPPYTYQQPLKLSLVGATISATYGYNPWLVFDNDLTSALCGVPPTFNQAVYNVTTPEDAPIGTVLLTVVATAPGVSSLVYSLAGANKDGALSPVPTFVLTQGGALVVNGSLSYKTQPFYSLQVTAKNPLTQQLGIARVLVNVTRVYVLPAIAPLSPLYLPQNLPLGSVVTVVTATAQNGGPLQYGIETGVLAIDGQTGVVTLVGNLTLGNFTQVVTVSDTGLPPLSSTANLSVVVLPAAPLVLQFASPVLNLTVPDNTTVGTVVAVLQASVTGGGGSASVQYFVTQPSVSTPFFLNSTSGELYASRNLQYTSGDLYMLQVVAVVTNASSTLSATAIVFIRVIAVNSNGPVFSKPAYTAYLLEMTPPGTLNITVLATDKDSGPNGQVWYRLSNTTFLSINNVTGFVTNLQALDYELVQRIDVNVMATDLGTPPQSSVASVTVIVLDVNAAPSIITITPPYPTVNQSAAAGFVVAVARAFEPDSPAVNEAVSFSIMGEGVSVFNISSTTGEIVVAFDDVLGYEVRTNYSVVVVATDVGWPPLSSNVTLTIQVIDDVNDYPPIFNPSSYNIVINESLAVNTPILRLSVSDSDYGSNAAFVLSITAGNTNDTFAILQDGTLVLRGPLNYHAQSSYLLTVTATDVAPGVRPATAVVQVMVTEVNEPPPVFNASQYRGEVVENVSQALVIQVHAADQDGSNITYQISNVNFTVDSQGRIFTAQPLDRETTPVYYMYVTAVADEHGWPTVPAVANITVVVLDINDNAPTFRNLPKSLSFPELTPVGTNLTTFEATDPDNGTNGTVQFYLWQPQSPQFNLTSTGQLVLAQPFNGTVTTAFMLVVVAQDLGSPPLSTEATVNITVVLSAQPVFLATTYTASIVENNAPGVFLLQVAAAARDPGVNIVYSIGQSLLPAAGMFAVDPVSGAVTVLVPLDRDQQQFYNFTVVATGVSNGTNLSASAIVVVTVLYQSAPLLSQNVTSVSIPETAPAGSYVATVNATSTGIGLNNSVVAFNITGGDPYSLFRVDQTGLVTTARSLVDQTGSYSLVVRVSNLPAVGALSSLALLSVNVTPVNMYAPVFQSSPYVQSVREDAALGSVLLRFVAFDNDTGTAGQIASYTLIPGSSSGPFPFALNASSGALLLASHLDYGVQHLYSFEVTATDRGIVPLSTDVNATIVVLDVTNNPPIFTQPYYVSYVPEDLPPGQTILQVTTTDADGPANSIVVYSLLSGTDMFVINATSGVLLSNAVFDREVVDSYNITVQAFNPGADGVNLSSTVVVTVIIEDVNDNAPQFTSSSYSLTLRAPIASGTVLIQVNATDPDPRLNGTVRYGLTDPTNVFAIDPISGIVTLAANITVGSNYSILVLAYDLGSPPMSNSTFLNVRVLPPIYLSSGRAQDLSFTTQQGIFLLNPTSMVATDSYQQELGFAAGRSPSEQRNVTVDQVGGAAFTVTPLLEQPDYISSVLLTSEVWPDNPRMVVAVQVRDSSHNVQTQPWNVTVVVTLLSSFANISATCLTSSANGTCVVAVVLPDVWFSGDDEASVAYGLSPDSLVTLGSVPLWQGPSLNPLTLVSYVYMKLPLTALFPGTTFQVPVYGTVGTAAALGSYTVVINPSSYIDLLDFVVAAGWVAQMANSSGGGVTVTGVWGDRFASPPNGESLLFTMTVRLSAEVTFDSNTLPVSVVTGSVLFLASSDFSKLLSTTATDQPTMSILTLTRKGTSAFGFVFVVQPTPLGLFPYASYSNLVNTALLNGSNVSVPLTVLLAMSSGTLQAAAAGGGPTCSSLDVSSISVMSDCSAVLLTPVQTQGSPMAEVLVSYAGLEATLPLRVWVPLLPVSLAATQTTLYAIPGLPFGCAPLYQRATVHAYATFTDLVAVVTGVDVTRLLAQGSIVSTNSSVVTVAASNRVKGVGVGSAEVKAILPTSSSSISITVSPYKLNVFGLDVQVVTGLSVSSLSSSLQGPQESLALDVNFEQAFDFEGVRGAVLTAAVFGDGSRMALDVQDGLFYRSADNHTVSVTGPVVTAVGTGAGRLVEVFWSPASCPNSTVASGTGWVNVSTPIPAQFLLGSNETVLSAPGSVESSGVGISSVASITVIAVYPSGATQDLSGDTRTVYSVPQGLTLTKVGNVTLVQVSAIASPGIYWVNVSFAQFTGVKQVLNVTVVNVKSISMSAFPYPPYYGSSYSPITTLSLISGTRVRQKALLVTTATLTNGASRDISHLPTLRFQNSTSFGNLNALDITNSVLSVTGTSLSGLVFLSASLSASLSAPQSSSLVIAVSSTPVLVTAIAIEPFPSNLFTGVKGTTYQTVVNVTFSDNTTYERLALSNQILPNLITFSASPSSAITIDPTTGVAMLVGNYLYPATVRATAVQAGASISGTLDVLCNLQPGVGDIDLGDVVGVPIATQTVGNAFNVSVQVNSGTDVLNSVEYDILFDPTVLTAVSVTPGPDWPSTGIFIYSVNDARNIISIGGSPVNGTLAQGSMLHLATVTLLPIGASASSDITGVIKVLSKPGNGALDIPPNIVPLPANFTAGAVQVAVLAPSSRRRSIRSVVTAPPLQRSLVRRQTCSSCTVCSPARETGDVDGNCVFEVLDVLFLQLFYLTTVTSGAQPQLPPERAQYLDADLDGVVDPNDVAFMLRVYFHLLRFVTGIVLFPVNGSHCQLAVNVTLSEPGNRPADSNTTALLLHLTHSSPLFQQLLAASNFTVGGLVAPYYDKGLSGGLVQAEYLGGGVFGFEAYMNANLTDIGVSPVQVTFDSLGATSPLRLAPMYAQTTLQYGGFVATLGVLGSNVTLRSLLGFSPLRSVSNSLTSTQCLLQSARLVFDAPYYLTSVPENATVGTPVVQVRAVSQKPGVTVAYYLGPLAAFGINATTGLIALLQPLNYGTQTQHNLTVFATYDGWLSNISTLVIIDVINVIKLPPYIYPVSNISLTTSHPVGELILTVNATDPDHYGNLVYTMTVVPSGYNGLLGIDPHNGTVSITASLAQQADSTFMLNISVSDSIFTSYVAIFVSLYRVDFTTTTYFANVSEGAPIGTAVAQLSLLNDNISLYTLSLSPQTQDFRVNSSGALLVNQMLDRELTAFYSLQATAVYRQLYLVTIINITVLDVNDNPPVFHPNVQSIILLANTPVGSPISSLQFTVTDADAGSNALFVFSLSSPDGLQLFSIDSVTGVVALAHSLYAAASSFAFTILASDGGNPSLNGSCAVAVGVATPNASAYPSVPALVTTAGLYPTGTVQSSTPPLTFVQNVTVLSVGTGELAVTYGGLRAVTTLVAPPQPAANVAFSVLHYGNTVYSDATSVLVAAQAWDADHSPGVEIFIAVTATASWLAFNNTASSNCTTDQQYGVCIVNLTIPESWFSALPQTILLTSPPGVWVTNLTLHPLTPPPPPAAGVRIDLPQKDVLPGEEVVLAVYGFLNYNIVGVSLLIDIDPMLSIYEAVATEPAAWAIQTSANGTQFGVAAILASPSNASPLASTSWQFLFSLRGTVTSVTTPYRARVSATVVSMSDVWETINSAFFDSAAVVVDRDGSGSSGFINIMPDVVMSLHPWTAQPRLLNTAALDGTSVTSRILLLSGYLSGELLPYQGPVTCSSSDPSVVGVDVTCRYVRLIGTETAGGDGVGIRFHLGNLTAYLPLRVFYPDPPQLGASNVLLKRVEYSLISPCQRTYQHSSVYGRADFTAGPHRIAGTLVTQLLVPRLYATNTSTLLLLGASVQGITAGNSSLCANTTAFGPRCVQFQVSDSVVYVSGLGLTPGVELGVTASGTGIPPTTAVQISLRTTLLFLKEKAAILAAVLYSDGTWEELDGSTVVLGTPSNPAFSVAVRDVTANGSGMGVLPVKWTPTQGSATCGVSVSANVPIVATLATNASLVVTPSVSPTVHLLAWSSDAAAIAAGYPTLYLLSVLLVQYSMGLERVVDVTLDTETLYQSYPSGALAISQRGSGGIAVFATGVVGGVGGMVGLNLSFGGLPVVTLLFELVWSAQLDLAMVPYPPYPGYLDHRNATLSLIENTGVWQRGALIGTVTFTDGTYYDVSNVLNISVSSKASSVLAVNGLVVMAVGLGMGQVVATLGSVQASVNISVLPTRVNVTGLVINPLGNASTLRGVAGSTGQSLTVNLTFSDGTRYPYFAYQIPGLVRYNASSTSINLTTDGRLQPLANTPSPIQVQASAGSATSITSFYVNLDPDIGDVDLGQPFGPPVTVSMANSTFAVPMYVNTGLQALGSVDILVTYDARILSLQRVFPGGDWTNGLYELATNDPAGEVRFGGVLCSGGVLGERIHLFTVEFAVMIATPTTAIYATVLTLAQNDLHGSSVGLSTPRPAVAGNVLFSAGALSKKRHVPTEWVEPLVHRRTPRATQTCATPPCDCSNLTLGDTDGNCVFDIRDVYRVVLYIGHSLVGLVTPQSLGSLTGTQASQLDPNVDLVVDTGDAYFLLRALLDLTRPVASVQMVPVQDLGSQCLFSILVDLWPSSTLTSVTTSTNVSSSPWKAVDVFVDVGFPDPTLQLAFASSILVRGKMVSLAKGPNLTGGVVLAERASMDGFIVQLNSSFVSGSVGVFVVVVTYDSSNRTSLSRTIRLSGPFPFTYPGINYLLPARGFEVALVAQYGYSPLSVSNTTLLSVDCSAVPIITSLVVTFPSARQATLSWSYLDVWAGKNFTGLVDLDVIACGVNQSGVSLGGVCTEGVVPVTGQPTSVTIQVLPFTEYRFQVRISTAVSAEVQARSPEAGK